MSALLAAELYQLPTGPQFYKRASMLDASTRSWFVEGPADASVWRCAVEGRWPICMLVEVGRPSTRSLVYVKNQVFLPIDTSVPWSKLVQQFYVPLELNYDNSRRQ